MKIQKFTITSGASVFGVTRETLKRALARAGEKTGNGQTYTIKTLHNALAGDVRGERARLLKAQADEVELKVKQKRSELVSIPTMERQLWQNIYLPMRNNLETMPERLAPLIAPDDAGRVQTILRDAVEELKAACREPQTQTKNENEK